MEQWLPSRTGLRGTRLHVEGALQQSCVRSSTRTQPPGLLRWGRPIEGGRASEHAELLTGVLGLAKRSRRWRETKRLPSRLDAAIRFFYPDAINKGYRPDVVDFFSALRTYIDVGAGLQGGFRDAPELFRTLKLRSHNFYSMRSEASMPSSETVTTISIGSCGRALLW